MEGQTLGIITAAAQLGVEAILVKPKRAFGPFTAPVTLREKHIDELEITDQPVEQGARISDHAYKRPYELILECGWSNSPQNIGLVNGLVGAVTQTVSGISSIITGNSIDQVRDIYAKLVLLQEQRIPFDVFTGKRNYKDMLIKTLETTTDKETENALFVTVTLRQVIIVRTQTVNITAPASAQLDPGSTLPAVDRGTLQLGAVSNFNAAAALRAGIDAVTVPPVTSVLGLF